MGKRKYEKASSSDSKLLKDEESSANVDEGEEEEQPQTVEGKPEKRAKLGSFDVKHFRKELSTKSEQTMVLTQFLQVCLNPDNDVDYLLEYLRSGGNSHEILRQITDGSKKNLTLTTPVFHLFHLIILKVQSSLPHMISITEEACRYFLNNYMSTVEIMISESSGPRHRKIILKLLTSMVTLNADLGVEVLSHAPLTPKHLQYIVEKTNYKEKDNVRTCFVHFMTSFLVHEHLPLVKALLEKQGLLALVIPGLVQDEAEAVLMFLNILKDSVIQNTFISKSLKLKTFSHQVLHNIFKVFSWKGPPDLSYEVRNEMRPKIMSLLSEIILTLFTSHKIGLYFVDNSFGTGDVHKNQNLYKALLTLKRPWENEHECETILQIVYKCPDLHRAVMTIVEQSFEPQHSPIWEKTVEFTIQFLDKMKPENVVPRMQHLNASQTANFIRFVTLPVPLLKYIQNNLEKDPVISIYCIKVLVKMLQTLKRYMQILEVEDSSTRIADLKNKLDYFVPKHFPLPTTIVALIQNVIAAEAHDVTKDKANDYRLPLSTQTESLIYLTDLLLLYNDVHPALFEMLEGNIDMKQILEYSNTLTTGNVALLKFKIVSLWLTLDRTAISLKNPMFKDLFLIMLEVYTSDEDETWVEAKNTLQNFLKNTAIFEADEDEIHLVLYSLRHCEISKISLIADIVEDILKNIKELTEYIRNQTVHFEISDGSSEASLDKLFNDLIENRSTEDNVFLENKVPSTFIVGCMQFVQSNKEAKKNLKQFLSFYIASLFHSNYSPELTEVFIGDSKLDVRGYVTSWVSEAVPVPESLTEKDNVLRNMSASIIDKQQLSLTEIFPYLEESTPEEGDAIINDTAYLVNTRSIDSSELLIWARYLIFCTIRMTNVGILDNEHQQKITTYFNCLMTVGKKKHLINECRTIILTLFKNPYFLKIYRPMTKENDSSLLATQFLMDIITQNIDIVNYLNDKHKILKSYQQKNYTELIKIFIKIKKKKSLDSAHTVKVLEIVGMTNEDDLHVFGKIFALDVNDCVKDDKEPSFVLDVLQTLLKKYTNSIAVDTPEHVIRKSMKLYTELLTNKEISINLNSLECTLANYFENKTHHTVYVNDEIFKRFFNATTISKTTSLLASVLMKYNLKLCNVFKDQINKPEIVTQRELTLPLGTAALNHNQFLIENKEILNIIYNEYKSNISKVLEKPHKAGQIYSACWVFVRKLITECMDDQDCQKLYAKVQKFEVVEQSHVNFLQAVFMKMILNESCHKNEYLTNYLLTMLHLIALALKENKEDAILIEIMDNIGDVLLVCQSIDAYNVTQKENFKKVTESAVWQNVCKAILKGSLKVRTASESNMAGPRLLDLLARLVQLLYPADHEDIEKLFDMVTSHSEFVNVMLSHHSSDIKSRLLEFLYILIQLNKAVMKSQHIPVYLSAYHATRSPCDRIILALLHFYENNGQAVNEYKPYVFGDSAANHYAVRKSRTSSLWGHPTPGRVLNLFDREVIRRTVKHFPVNEKLEYHYELAWSNKLSIKETLNKMSKEGLLKVKAAKNNETAIKQLLTKLKYDKALEIEDDLMSKSHLERDEGTYDPAFLFPLLSHILAPGSVASCFQLLRTGLLSVAVMALSSHCPNMRAAAYHVLHRFCLLLETETRHKNDKLFLSDFINTLRQSLSSALAGSDKEHQEFKDLMNCKLPAVGALYLARALMVSTAPIDPLYKPVNNFFIAKQQLDLSVVPDFLTLFHDSEVEAADRRIWILEVIKDGVKHMSDVNVVFKTMCLKMIMDYYSSVLSDRKCKDRILSVVNAVISIPRAFEILIEGYGLMSWLHAVVRQLGKDDKALVIGVIKILENINHSILINSYSKTVTHGNTNKFAELKINKEVENEVLNILYNILQHTHSFDVEEIISYIKVYNLFSKRAIKTLSKKQILTLIGRIDALYKCNDTVKLLTNAVIANDGNILRSKIVLNSQSDALFKELITVTNVFLT